MRVKRKLRRYAIIRTKYHTHDVTRQFAQTKAEALRLARRARRRSGGYVFVVKLPPARPKAAVVKIKTKVSRRYSWLHRYEIVHNGRIYNWQQFKHDALRDARHVRHEYGGTVEVFKLRPKPVRKA